MGGCHTATGALTLCGPMTPGDRDPRISLPRASLLKAWSRATRIRITGVTAGARGGRWKRELGGGFLRLGHKDGKEVSLYSGRPVLRKADDPEATVP